MRRSELEHTIRAATEIIEADRIVIIGSQAILGSYTEDQLPPETTQSVEVDMAPLNDDDAETLATRLDAFIGEWSNFHQMNGYYVQGVGTKTAVLPAGWEERLVEVRSPNTNGRTGLCLDPHDLCLAKLAASREKDFTFVGALIESGLVRPSVRVERVPTMTTADPQVRAAVSSYLQSHIARGNQD